jgi:pyruvate dehydrogenase E2 component (dihydrolipoamide acetyltransferase)
MPVEVVLPKVDMDMESGIIIEWKVAEGARVRLGDILFDIETSKSVMEVESPGSGVIRQLAPVTGEPIAVGTSVAWIYDEHEAQSPAHPREAAPPGEVRATPAARKLARELNVDLATVTGSGPGGRIVEDDLKALVAAAQSAPASAALAADQPTQGSLVPFNPVRRIVAQRLAESMRTVPHFYLSAQIDMTGMRELARRIEPDVVRAAGSKPGVTVLIAYIVARVLAGHPRLNASVEGEAMRTHDAAHIGIAIERDGDLVVPVLRDAGTRTLVELARDFAQLRDAVRDSSIKPAQMRGGTFTLSNLGMYDVDAFTAIINPPECAILAIGRTQDAPVVRDGQVVVRPIATFTLSSDHRIVDGVAAARFMSALRQAIEHPDVVP